MPRRSAILVVTSNGCTRVLKIPFLLAALAIAIFLAPAPTAGVPTVPAAITPADVVTATEFLYVPDNRYFLTVDPAEAAAIDAGAAGAGWQRTGFSFRVFGTAGAAPENAVPVCRFYGSIAPGPNSHFFTASAAECDQLRNLQATTPATQKRWNYEGIAFRIQEPDAARVCPTRTIPVYRAYNNGFARGIDSNHRFSTSAAEIQRVVVQGWLDEGAVFCAPDRFFLTSISTAGTHTCAIDAQQQAWCWGLYYGLGTGTDTTSIPTRVAGTHRFTAIDAGDGDDGYGTCAIDIDQILWCWGMAVRVGDGTDQFRAVPVRTRSDLKFAQLASGDTHACALATNGDAWCWGSNVSGAIGDGTFEDRYAPVKVVGNKVFKRLAAGDWTTCGITTAGETWCWGRWVGGDARPAPQRMVPDPGLEQVSAGLRFACGLTAAGTAWCWGSNFFGNLGNGNTTDSESPVRVTGNHVFADITVGHGHACARDMAGGAWCWGQGLALGDDNGAHSSVPVRVAGGLVFTRIDAGDAATCGLTANGEGWCWGDNEDGALGDRTTSSRLRPVRVIPP